MGAWPVGLSTGCFYQKSIFDCLEAIAASGFDRVEGCSSPAHLDYHDKTAVRRAAERLNALGIEAYSFHAPFADHIDITSPDCQARNASLQDVFSAVQAAGTLGSHILSFIPARNDRSISWEKSELDAWKTSQVGSASSPIDANSLA
jgi:sugar phosphate isomerase/epimerase